jgi:hypothetical protein
MDIVDMLLMKLQFAVTCTICQIQSPALLDSWVKNTFSQNVVATKWLLALIFV